MERFHVKVEHGDVLVSTAFCTDVMEHETAIKVGEKPWVCVEIYPGQAEAEVGHVRWLAEVTSGRREFKEVRTFEQKMAVVFAFLGEMLRPTRSTEEQ